MCCYEWVFRPGAGPVYSQLFYYMKVYAVENYRRYISPERFREVMQEEMPEETLLIHQLTQSLFWTIYMDYKRSYGR
jgi:hypothetical protein